MPAHQAVRAAEWDLGQTAGSTVTSREPAESATPGREAVDQRWS
ncbi:MULTISPECIES: hypothetical protein [Kitasatospora]